MKREETVHVAFVGNPNCGKTTLFNAITGSKLKVANWPGVTVEKIEGEAEYEDRGLISGAEYSTKKEIISIEEIPL